MTIAGIDAKRSRQKKPRLAAMSVCRLRLANSERSAAASSTVKVPAAQCQVPRGWRPGACSLLADRSAALSRRAAATSGLVVAFVNFRRVAACSVRYFLPPLDHSHFVAIPAYQLGNPTYVPRYCAKRHAVTNWQKFRCHLSQKCFRERPPPVPSRCACRSHRVRHLGASHTEGFRRPAGGVPRGLMLHFRVQLRTEQDDDRRDP